MTAYMRKCFLTHILVLATFTWMLLSSLGAHAQEQVTIRFWKAAHGNDVELYRPIIAEFERLHPHIKVDFLSHPWEGWDERYGTAFAANNPPDVAYMPDEFWPRFAEAGQLARLDELFPEDMKAISQDYPENFWSMTYYRGHQYAIPYLWVAVALLYNRDMFQAAGIPEPPASPSDPNFDTWTWDQFVVVAQQLTDARQDRWGFAWSAAFRDPNYLYSYFYQAGVDILDVEQNRAAFNNEAGVQALQFLVDLVHKYQVVPAAGMHPQFHQLFFEGQAAMAPVESYMLPIVREQYPKLNVGAALQPQGPGRNFFDGRGVWGNAGFFVISEASKHKAAAFEFVKWLTNQQNAQAYATGVGLFGARRDFAPPDDPLYEVFMNSVPYVPGYPLHPRLRQVHSIMMAETQAAVLLQKTPAEAIADAARQVDALLAR